MITIDDLIKDFVLMTSLVQAKVIYKVYEWLQPPGGLDEELILARERARVNPNRDHIISMMVEDATNRLGEGVDAISHIREIMDNAVTHATKNNAAPYTREHAHRFLQLPKWMQNDIVIGAAVEKAIRVNCSTSAAIRLGMAANMATERADRFLAYQRGIALDEGYVRRKVDEYFANLQELEECKRAKNNS